jgi:hypothetical protein
MIADAQATVDFLHELAGTRDVLEHIRAFLVRANLVGQLAASPVVGLVQRPRIAADDFLDLGVEVCDLLLGRVGRNDVDELVLPGLTHVLSPSGPRQGATHGVARSG